METHFGFINPFQAPFRVAATGPLPSSSLSSLCSLRKSQNQFLPPQCRQSADKRAQRVNRRIFLSSLGSSFLSFGLAKHSAIGAPNPSPAPPSLSPAQRKTQKTVYDFTALDIDQKNVSLRTYAGKLEEIYEKYRQQGLEILAFPSNQFGKQEPGSNEDIKKFVEKYHVSFPLFDKIDVNGRSAHPLYNDLLRVEFPGDIKWNFEKFLVDRNGVPVKRYWPGVPPNDIVPDMLALLDSAP